MFGLGTFLSEGEAFPGLVVGSEVRDLRPHLGSATTTGRILQDWEANLPLLRELSSLPAAGLEFDRLQTLAPVQPAGQLLCAGANYEQHVRQIMFTMARNAGDPRSDDDLRAFAEEQVSRQRRSGQPFMFAGLTSAIVGPRDDVVLWGPGEQHDWELELAVVVGRPARRVSLDAAMEHVAGYTISNDISVRDVMNRPGLALTDFLQSKCRPTFFPTGPYIVPREFVPDPTKLRLQLRVNGELMQDEYVSDIIFGIDELVSYASHLVDLSPGDVILTGSPAGNAGHHGNRWLRPGDVLDGEITGLGQQRNICVAPPA